MDFLFYVLDQKNNLYHFGEKFRFGLRFQPVDATHWLNRSAGASKFNVSLGLSLRRLATAFNLF